MTSVPPLVAMAFPSCRLINQKEASSHEVCKTLYEYTSICHHLGKRKRERERAQVFAWTWSNYWCQNVKGQKSHHIQTCTFLYFPPDFAKDPRYVSVHYTTLPRKPPAGLNDIKLVSRLSFCNDLVSIFKVLHLSLTLHKYLPGLHFCWDGTNQSKFKLQYTLPR